MDVLTSCDISAPREVVSAFAADPDNATRWYANIRTVAWETEPPLQVGSRLRFVAAFLGRELAYTYEVVQHDPGEVFVMRTAEGPFPMETTYRWSDIPGGTRMELRNAGEPSGFARISAPVMAAAMRRANNKDLRALKRLLEGGAAAGA